jgi:2-polyprenyl-3-methyl-5-hydroxy-6-metoxy-1,4-benzoquinol methylase
VTWRDVTDAPTSVAARAHRGATLDAAFRADARDRLDLLRDLCAGRSVLDVGCVDHEAALVGRPGWLHGELVAVAASCVGLDPERDGIEAMRRRGFDAFEGRVDEVPEEVRHRSPFDVVVAGEIIEHLPDPSALFAMAADLLVPGGSLAVTTPNPYAPWRARAGQLGLTWENVDHLTYLFPSGLAEMAERHGFRLERVSTSGTHRSADSVVASIEILLKAIARRVLRRPADPFEYPPTGRFVLQLPPAYVNPLEWLVLRRRSALGHCGEHAFYTFVRVAGAPIGPGARAGSTA